MIEIQQHFEHFKLVEWLGTAAKSEEPICHRESTCYGYQNLHSRGLRPSALAWTFSKVITLENALSLAGERSIKMLLLNNLPTDSQLTRPAVRRSS
jgi:hypothetical protein